MESAEGLGPITLVGVVCTARVSDTNPFASNNPRRLLQSIALNPSRFVHTADLERAAYILVAGSATRFYYDLICSPLYRAFGRKIFVLDFTDRTVPIIPGLYTSLGPSPDTSLYKQTFYMGAGANTALAVSPDAEPQFLAWFRGNPATEPDPAACPGTKETPHFHWKPATPTCARSRTMRGTSNRESSSFAREASALRL